MIRIMQMAEFNKYHHDMIKEYKRPSECGVYEGKLVAAHWVTHRYVHSYWILKNGKKLDLILFPETNWLEITEYEIGETATLYLEKTGSNTVYLRKIKKVEKALVEKQKRIVK